MTRLTSLSTDLQLARSEALRVTALGMVLDLLLGLTKIIGGVLTQSFALVTDGIHSLTDAVTDIFVLVVTRMSYREADTAHPYGHGRFETLGTIAMGIVFFTTAGIILFNAYERLLNVSVLAVPGSAALALALLSIACKEWIYHYTMRTARRLDSNLLKANAWHSRSDAITSIAVLAGLLGARAGYVWMDTVAAIVVALIIAKIGWELCADSLRELVDTAVPEAREQQLRARILSVEGIRSVPVLRSRQSGGKIILEAHLLVDPHMSVSEGHQLGERVRATLLGHFSDIGDVVTHIDPATHDQGPDQRLSLPARDEVLAALKLRWNDLLAPQQIDKVVLHYLEHGIEVELVLNLEQVPGDLVQQLDQALGGLDFVAGLRIYNKLYEGPLTARLS